MNYSIRAFASPEDKSGFLIHDPRVNLHISSGKLSQKENEVDTVELVVNSENRLFDKVAPFQTHIEISDGSSLIFRGRALKPVREMKDNGQFTRTYVFESIKSYLIDSVQQFIEVKNTTPKDFLQYLINEHNAQVPSYKQFTLRNVDVTNDKDDASRKVDYATTADSIKSLLIDSLGGYLIAEYKDGKNYLDYLKHPGTEHKNDTAIQLSKNLKAVAFNQNPADVKTRFIPLGAQIETQNPDKKVSEDSADGSSVSGPMEPVNGDWRPVIRFAAKCMGLNPPDSNIETIVKLIQNESGGNETVQNNWDPNAQAGHPSIGLMQYIQSTFDSYAIKGYTNIKKGFHQLIAYYNDSNWESDVGIGYNGKDGEWRGNASGPSGTRRRETLAISPTQAGSGGAWGSPFPDDGHGTFSGGQLFGVHAGGEFRQNGFHDGLDFGSADHPGHEVHAVHPGTVTHKGSMDGFYYFVTHSNDGYNIVYQEAFAGLNSILVSVGDTVKTGQVVGYRDTGGSNEHLHVGVTKKDFNYAVAHSFSNDGTWDDPEPLIFSTNTSNNTVTIKDNSVQDASTSNPSLDKQTLDIQAGVDLFNKAKVAHLQYQMNNLRANIFTDQKYSDCSAFVSFFVELAIHSSDRTAYSTETLHGFLTKNGYALHYEGNTRSLPAMQTGDVIIMGRKGASAGANGHTAVMKDSDTVLECSSGWPGGYPSGADVFEHNSSSNPNLNDWFSYDANHWGGEWYWYLYRFSGNVPDQPSGDQKSGTVTSGVRYTIAPVNDGLVYLDIPELQKVFGVITGFKTWDSIKDPNELLKAGKQWITDQKVSVNTWTISVLELDSNKRFEMYDKYQFINPFIAEKQLLTIVGKDTDLVNWNQSTISIGDTSKKLTDYQKDINAVKKEVSNLKRNYSETVKDVSTSLKKGSNVDDQIQKIYKKIGNVDIPQITKDMEGIKEELKKTQGKVVDVDLNKAKLLFQYDNYKDHLGSSDYAMQYIKQFKDNLFSSHHYQDQKKFPQNTTDAVEFVRRDLKGNYIDDMIVWNAPKGSSFGIAEDSGQVYLFHPVFTKQDGKQITWLAKIPYKPNTEIDGMDSSIIRTFSRLRPFDSAYDSFDDYFSLLNETGGGMNVFEGEDVRNGEYIPSNSLNLANFGINITGQTVQSYDLKMPYVFLISGNADMHDKRMIYCIDVVKGNLVFEKEITFSSDVIKAIGNFQEPKAISVYRNNESYGLLISFNMGLDNGTHTEVVYDLPISGI